MSAVPPVSQAIAYRVQPLVTDAAPACLLSATKPLFTAFTMPFVVNSVCIAWGDGAAYSQVVLLYTVP